MGYDKDENGQLIINKEQAAVVRRIFKEYLEGWTQTEIARHLIGENIPGVTGKAVWPAVTIRRMLRNEKYKGDLLMQKYYTVSYLTKELAENDGKFDQYYVKGAHQGIVSEEEWEAVQLEMRRREEFRQEHGIRESGSITGTAFFGKVFCADCGGHFVRKHWKGIREPFWKCCHAEKKGGSTCVMGNVRESDLREAFRILWNDIVRHRKEHMTRWEEMETNGNALERIRAKQMKELTAEGPLDFEIPELTRMVLQEVTVLDPLTFTITLLDGTERNISL